jgi:uncharacterized protein (DUF488 family)
LREVIGGMAETRLTLFTIGHSNLSGERLVEALHSQEIDVLVDVRSMPYSRYSPHFNRETLQTDLMAAGIDYRFAGDHLGGRPKDPTCYKRGVLPPEGADYLQEVDYEEVARREPFRAGVQRLLELAAAHRVAIMCSEEDPAECHRRHLIARFLPPDVQVIDIRTKEGVVRAVPAEPLSQQLSLL